MRHDIYVKGLVEDNLFVVRISVFLYDESKWTLLIYYLLGDLRKFWDDLRHELWVDEL